MSIDAVKTKKTKKPGRLPPKPAQKKPADPNMRAKMSLFVTAAAILVIGLWAFSLKVNVDRLSQKELENQTTDELSGVKEKFDSILSQTADFINTANAPTSTAVDPGSTGSSLSQDRIKDISESIKSNLGTTTPTTTIE